MFITLALNSGCLGFESLAGHGEEVLCLVFARPIQSREENAALAGYKLEVTLAGYKLEAVLAGCFCSHVRKNFEHDITFI